VGAEASGAAVQVEDEDVDAVEQADE